MTASPSGELDLWALCLIADALIPHLDRSVTVDLDALTFRSYWPAMTRPTGSPGAEDAHVHVVSFGEVAGQPQPAAALVARGGP